MKLLQILCLFAVILRVAPLSAADPDPVAVALEPFVQEGQIAGAVTLVARKDQVLSLQAVGFQDLETRTPMATDSLFWIASMTKPVTALAVLMLHDDRRLDILDPVEKYLPEFKGQLVVREKKDDTVVLGKPARPVTLKDLLTHTGGVTGNPNAESGALDVLSLRESALVYALTPLQFEPGSRWAYSNPGINVLGRVIEVVTGEDYAKALDRLVFRPLGMRNTTFWPDKKRLEKLAVSYQADPDGRLVPAEIRYLTPPYSDKKRSPLAAGGLFSTAEDLHKLYVMLDSDGEILPTLIDRITWYADEHPELDILEVADLVAAMIEWNVPLCCDCSTHPSAQEEDDVCIGCVHKFMLNRQARKIQRVWRQVISDPTYGICRNRLRQEYEQLQ